MGKGEQNHGNFNCTDNFNNRLTCLDDSWNLLIQSCHLDFWAWCPYTDCLCHCGTCRHLAAYYADCKTWQNFNNIIELSEIKRNKLFRFILFVEEMMIYFF